MKILTIEVTGCRAYSGLTLTSLALLIISGCSSGPGSSDETVPTASVDGNESAIAIASLPISGSTDIPALAAANPDTGEHSTVTNAMQSVGPTVSSAADTTLSSTPDTTPINNQPAVTANFVSKRVTLTWKPAAADDLGYYIYYSKGSDDSYMLARQVTLSPDQSVQQHQLQLDASDDLGLSASDTVCFAVSAWNTFGESSRSAPKCIQVDA